MTMTRKEGLHKQGPRKTAEEQDKVGHSKVLTEKELSRPTRQEQGKGTADAGSEEGRASSWVPLCLAH